MLHTNDYTENRPIVELESGCLYLNHASFSPLSKPVRTAMEDFLDKWQSGTFRYYPYFQEQIPLFKTSIAKWIGADSSQIIVTPNSSAAFSMLANGLSWQAGDRLMIFDNEFPANAYAFMALARKGVEIDMVPYAEYVKNPQILEKFVTKKTKLFSLSYVSYLTGLRLDLQKLSAFCKAHNLIFSVDGTQGVGVCPLDVSRIDIDFLSVSGYKWLMWPWGTSFAYVSKRMLDRLEPSSVGWFSVEDPLALLPLKLSFAHDARRFENGGYNAMGIVGAIGAMGNLAKLGQEAIEKKVSALVLRLAAELKSRGFSLHADYSAKNCSGIVVFSGGDCEKIYNALNAKKIIVTFRQNSIRVSPHFYQSDADIDRFLHALDHN